MKRSLLFFLLPGLAVGIAASILQRAPGYMDAEYYTLTGMQLAQGKGFFEPFLWNYLNNPTGIPAPSHLYWMPLPSLLAAAGMIVSGKTSFFFARLGFIALAALIPWLTAMWAFRVFKDIRKARLAGWFGVFAGFYCVYATLPETFLPTMIGGAIFLWLALDIWEARAHPQRATVKFLLLGLMAGLMHLTRADGILWLVCGVVFWCLCILSKRKVESVGSGRAKTAALLALVLGYMILMAPWYARNVHLFGQLMPPGSGRAAWISEYNQTFIFPASLLTFTRWLQSGIKVLASTRWEALKWNTVTLLMVQGGVFLFPLMIWGFVRKRSEFIFQFAAWINIAIFLVMTVCFPLAGMRGGYLHSASALQIPLWALAAEGMEGWMYWGGRVRKWKVEKAERVFSTTLVLMAGFATAGIFWARVIGPDMRPPLWEAEEAQYRQVAERMNTLGIGQEERIFLINPPGFTYVSGRESLVTPEGGMDALLQVSDKFDVHYLLLEKDHVAGLEEAYRNPQAAPCLELIEPVGTALLFRIVE